MSKLIDKIKATFAKNPQVDTAKKAVIQAAKSVATEITKPPAKKRAPAKKSAAKKQSPRPQK